MIALAGAAVVTALLVWLVPWRAPGRPLGPERVHGRSMPGLATGGARWGALVMGAAVVFPLAVPVVVAWPSWRRWAAGRRHRADERQLALRALPETADLIGLGLAAGHSVRGSVRHAVVWLGDPYRSIFDEALRRSAAGEAFAVAIDVASVDLDPVAQPLIGLLVAAESDGGSLLAGLRRVSDEARHRRRVAAEARARRLPVTMLLPLVFCGLPAFGLLAVAPMVLASVGDLDLGI